MLLICNELIYIMERRIYPFEGSTDTQNRAVVDTPRVHRNPTTQSPFDPCIGGHAVLRLSSMMACTSTIPRAVRPPWSNLFFLLFFFYHGKIIVLKYEWLRHGLRCGRAMNTVDPKIETIKEQTNTVHIFLYLVQQRWSITNRRRRSDNDRSLAGPIIVIWWWPRRRKWSFILRRKERRGCMRVSSCCVF